MTTRDVAMRIALCTCLAGLTSGMAGCSSPSSQSAVARATETTSGSPTSTTTKPAQALTKTFTSPLNQYTFSMTAGWTTQPATRRWTYPSPGPETPAQGSDILRDPTSSGLFPGSPGWGVSAQIIPAGMSDAQWRQWYLRTIGTSTSCNPPQAAYRPIVIDGHPGAIHGGLVGCNFTEAVVVAHHTGYVIAAYPNMDSETDQVYPEDLFEAMLRTVRLGPS